MSDDDFEDETPEYDLDSPDDRVRKRFDDASEAATYDPNYFEKLEPKLAPYEDLHAFLLLTQIMGSSGRHMIAGADHDVIYLDADIEEFDKKATDAQIAELDACGVHYSSEFDGLIMYV